jgi:predicted nucleic acid-binding protein
MKLKIYLDTSVISARFDTRNPARHGLTENSFAQLHQFDVYISDMTLDEITKTPQQELKKQMLLCVKSFTVLTETPEVVALVDKLLQNHAVPPSSYADAYHLAIAIVSGMDYLLSWNFKHIVRLKTKDIVRVTATVQGYRPIDIIAPTELI